MNIDIKHLAKLSRLYVDDAKVPKFQQEMEKIIEMVDNLPQLSGGNIGVDPSNPMQLREDKVTPSLRREEILRNAPQTEAGCVVVPKIVE